MSRLPLYERVESVLAGDIADGSLRPETQLLRVLRWMPTNTRLIGYDNDELHPETVANVARPSHRSDQQISDRPLGSGPAALIVGYGFMEHGFAKLVRGLDAFPAILQALGVPAPHLMGWLTILVEILGGLAVLLGALVPLASVPMAAVLLVAMVTVHLPYGFSSIKLLAVTATGAQFGPPGVGAVVALTYRATVDQPQRFVHSRAVGAHVGLTPKRYQSGETDYDGGVSKCGDALLRTMLYEAAQVLLTHSGKWSWLKAWGIRVAQRRGIRRAIVAVARRLAVVLHRMWVDGSEFRWRKGSATIPAVA
jgi:uncharacterized membrane protein YphA (DoxX/SURF4 family)